MKLEFEKIRVPNFARTKNAGLVHIKDMSLEDFKDYTNLWYMEMIKKHRQKDCKIN